MRNKIRQIRKQRGLTLVALGAAIGLTPQSVSRIENGKMRLSTGWMERIAAALNVGPADLLETSRSGGAELIGEIDGQGMCESVAAQPFRLSLPGSASRVVRLTQPCGPYQAGEYLVCVRLPQPRHDAALGHDCLVELADGARQLCRVVTRSENQPGDETFTLAGLASGSRVLIDQRVAWIAPVRMRLQFVL